MNTPEPALPILNNWTKDAPDRLLAVVADPAARVVSWDETGHPAVICVSPAVCPWLRESVAEPQYKRAYEALADMYKRGEAVPISLPEFPFQLFEYKPKADTPAATT